MGRRYPGDRAGGAPRFTRRGGSAPIDPQQRQETSSAMTMTDRQAPVLTWTEPDGIAVRGTLVLIPGRGEQPAHYERFGRRISADGYRVHAVTDPTADADLALAQITGQLADPGTPGPRVLAGSDTGALFAAGLAASGQVPGSDAVVLAGLPTAHAGPAADSWSEELESRTACPTHRARLSAPGLRRGALYEPVPDGWMERGGAGGGGGGGAGGGRPAPAGSPTP